MTDRETVREWLKRLPKASDEYIARKTGIPVEDVAEHAGILIETGGIKVRHRAVTIISYALHDLTCAALLL